MYTVKFLDNEAFDNLPYKQVGASIGVADKNSGIAYVRDRGNPMDIFTAYHELEHLKGDALGEHEDPDEAGVYYKKNSWMIPAGIAAAIFAPQILPGLFGGAGAGAATAGGMAATEASLQAPLVGSLVGKAGLSSIPGMMGAGAAGAAGAGIGSALSSGAKGVAQGVGTNLATGAIGNMMSPTKNAMNQFQTPQMPSPHVSQVSSNVPSPFVSQVSGKGGNAMGAGGGQGTVSKIRSDMELVRAAMSKGTYAGRESE